MALDPEELKRQRAERRAQQAERKRKLLIRLGIAALVLLVCGVLVFVLLPKDKDPAPPAAESTAPVEDSSAEEPSTEETKAPEEAFTVIHVAMAGDVNITDKVITSGGSGYDYTEMFMDVAHILAEADLAAVNLEGNFSGAPYGSSGSAPQEFAQALSDAGVDLVQLANSYSINQGLSGLINTINGVRAAGMEPVGVYEDQQAYKAGKGYTIQNVQGVKIAFVAFTKGMDGMALPAGSENCVNLLYNDYESTYQSVNSDKIQEVLNAVAQENPDITIAMVHWGSEYNDTISSSQERIAALLLENGVNAIVGTHPHYVHEMIFDEEEGTFIAYSLGDFLSDGEKAGSQYSVILDLEITKNNRNGNVQLSGFSYTPIYSYAEDWSNSLRVLRIHEAMAAYEDTFIGCVSDEVYQDMIKSLTRIESRISGEG